MKAAYSTANVRANLALMAGTYPQYNLAAEPELMRHIYEANVGVRLSEKHDVWVDAGIFSSHIGFESAISKDCWKLSRSIMAENSPYYEAGVKITAISKNQKWTFSGLLLNGWQRIKRPDGNTTPAFGTQIVFKPNDRITLNSSTFIGNDKPDLTKQMRYFHNLYGIFQLTNNTALTLAFDYGLEQQSKGSSDYNSWMTPVVLLKQKIAEKWSCTARYEYFCDPNHVIVSTGTPAAFKVNGYSVNFDYLVAKNAVLRGEWRTLKASEKIFDEGRRNDNTSLLFSLAVNF